MEENPKKVLFINPYSGMRGLNTAGISALRGFLEGKKIFTDIINFNRFLSPFYDYIEKDVKKINDFFINNCSDENFINTENHLIILDRICYLGPEKILRAVELNCFREYILNRLKEKPKFHFFAISLTYTSQIVFALFFVKLVREKYGTKVKIILGGTIISNHYEELLQIFSNDLMVDFLVIGLGEGAIFDILSGKNKNDIANLISSEKNKYVFSKKKCDYKNINFFSPPVYEDGDEIFLQSSRSCYWNRCSFCILDKNNTATSNLSFRCQASTVVKNMKFIRDSLSFKNNSYLFTDSCLDIRFINEFIKELSIKKETNNQFAAWMRCEDWLDYNLLKNMRKVGFNFLKFGPETFNPRLLKLLNKGFNPNKVFEVLDNCQKLKIDVILNFMIGLPTQTKEELLQDLKNIFKLAKKYNNIRVMWVHPLRVKKKSLLYYNPENYFIKLHNHDFLNDSIYWTQIKKNALSFEETREIFISFYRDKLIEFKNIKTMF